MTSTRKYLAVIIGVLFILGFSLPAGFASAEWRTSTREKIVLSTYPQVSDPDPQILAMMDQVESAALAGYVGDLSGENEVIIDGDATTRATAANRGCLTPLATCANTMKVWDCQLICGNFGRMIG